MKNIKRQQVESDLNKLYIKANKYTQKCQPQKALECIKVAAKWLYNYNFKYTAPEFEKLLVQNSQYLSVSEWKGEENRVTFFDSFAMDNRGLSLIYVKALVKLGYSVQFITYEENRKYMPRIAQLLESNSVNEIIFLRQNELVNAQIVVDNIKLFRSEKVIMHITPWDVSILLACYAMGGRIKKFLINITDHAFWLGKDAIDYCIEFRDYGANISQIERHISSKKIIKLPYYPAPTVAEFQGLPFDLKGKKMIFSGGNLYKISGSSIFYDIVHHILDNHKDTVFLYAGGGDNTELLHFIKNNHYEKRFYYIAERLDLDEIMKRCYFYLSTYPICGGLMAQYAIANGKIPITYTDGKNLCDEIDSFLVNTNEQKLSYYNLPLMLKEIDCLLEDEQYLKEKEKEWGNYLPSEQEFTIGLKETLQNYCTKYEINKFFIDTEAFGQIYFDSGNNNYYNYSIPIIKSKNIEIYFLFRKEILYGSWEYVKKKLKNITNKYIKRKR